jgi:hypothetical protein
MKRSFCWIAWIVLSIAACKEDQLTTVPDNVIIPGIGIGELSLGQSVKDDIVATYGTGLADTSLVGTIYICDIKYPDLGINFYLGAHSESEIFENITLNSIEFLENFKGKTLEGIQIGSTRSQVEAAYGSPKDDIADKYCYEIDGGGLFIVEFDISFFDNPNPTDLVIGMEI